MRVRKSATVISGGESDIKVNEQSCCGVVERGCHLSKKARDFHASPE